MLPALKKSALPSVEEAVRDVVIKANLTEQLQQCAKNLQLEAVQISGAVKSGESLNALCDCIEAIFLHGYKDKFSRRFVNFLSDSKSMPTPDFWPFVLIYTHRDALATMNQMGQIYTDIGRCRAWIRMALNENILVSYIEAMIQDKKAIGAFYRSGAYLLDREHPDICKGVLERLMHMQFDITVNVSALNMWQPKTLAMCGLWSGAYLEAPESVMEAMEVSEFFGSKAEEPENKAAQRKKPRSKLTIRAHRTASISTQSDTLSMDSELQAESTSTGDTVQAEETVDQECVSHEPTMPNNDVEVSLKNEIVVPRSEVSEEHQVNKVNEDPSVSEQPTIVLVQQANSNSSNVSSDEGLALESGDQEEESAVQDLIQELNLDEREGSVPPEPIVGSMPDTLDDDLPVGNLLSANKGGWSSVIVDENGELQESQSYDSLLQSYSKNMMSVPLPVGTPVLAELVQSHFPPEFGGNPISSPLSSSSSPPTGFEFISKPFEHDTRTQAMLSVYSTIQTESGLDQQDFECAGCSKPIGMIFGEHRVCGYDGRAYCSECFVDGDEAVIPARVVHNWDFRRYPVCAFNKRFLANEEQEPLLDIRCLNPLLYSVIPEMSDCRDLRTQLSFLQLYLFSCSDPVGESLKKLIWPRDYLYNHIHLYSTLDLLQVPSGVLARTLSKAIGFARKHVMSCQLCSQKGFVCELCSNPQVIFPFDTNDTHHCEKCQALYHRVCMTNNKGSCPKCERRRLRQNSTSKDSPASA